MWQTGSVKPHHGTGHCMYSSGLHMGQLVT